MLLLKILILINSSLILAKTETKQHTPASLGILSQGPGDGGGGDTCNGKLIESFKVDITKLPEFAKYISPILDKISPGDSPDLFSLRDLLSPSNKAWYMVDCKLQDVPKSRKGLYLETYQTAFQNEKEVFIDSTSYLKIDDENKAKLLLHEMLMSLYLLNNINSHELCQLKSVKNKCKNDKLETTQATIKLRITSPFDPSKIEKVTLDQVAHQNIRALVDWTWKNKQQLTEKNFNKAAREHKFDNWFTEIYDSSDLDSKEILDLSDINRGFKKFELDKKNNFFCEYDKQRKKFNSKCPIKLYLEIMKIDSDYSKVSVNFHSQKEEKQKQFKFEFKNSAIPSSAANIIRYDLPEIGNIATLRFIKNKPEIKNGQLPKAGEETQILAISFIKKSQDEMVLASIVFKTFRWHSFEKVPMQKGNIKYFEVYGYNSEAPEFSDIFMSQDSSSSFFEVGTFFDSKQLIGHAKD